MAYSYYDYLEYYYYEEYVDYYDELYNGSYNGTYPTYEQPYPMDIFNPIFFGESLLCAIIAIILMSFIFRHIYLRHKKGKLGTDKIIIGLTLFCLICHALHCVIASLSYYSWYIQYDVNWATNVDLISDIFWFLSRTSMYFIFLYQYYKIYNASSGFRSSKRCNKYLIFGFLGVVYCFQTAAFATYLINFYIYMHEEHRSPKKAYLTADVVFISLDFIMFTSMAYLLTSSILKLIVYQISVNTSPESQLAQYVEEGTASAHSSQNSRSMSTSTYNRQMSLIHTTTRIALTCAISMMSSFTYQLTWHIAETLEHWDLIWFTYTWNIDSIINMVCVYFVMAVARDHYRIICVDTCKCHTCCLQCVLKLIESKTKIKMESPSERNEAEMEEVASRTAKTNTSTNITEL